MEDHQIQGRLPLQLKNIMELLFQRGVILIQQDLLTLNVEEPQKPTLGYAVAQTDQVQNQLQQNITMVQVGLLKLQH